MIGPNSQPISSAMDHTQASKTLLPQTYYWPTKHDIYIRDPAMLHIISIQMFSSWHVFKTHRMHACPSPFAACPFKPSNVSLQCCWMPAPLVSIMLVRYRCMHAASLCCKIDCCWGLDSMQYTLPPHDHDQMNSTTICAQPDDTTSMLNTL